ncbi:hypothetical protein BJY04DRAFT_194388 [Aspergillus karnatakaensis]|uniref:uncharacterized protein n=1 Tax=Aspergillus karnatakaensis TaxID=1810916 RepID=UPI003CCD41E1
MSRNFVSPLIAIVAGIGTGYYAFQPAFRDLQREKEVSASQSAAPAPAPAPAQPQSPDQKPAADASTTPVSSSTGGNRN